MQVEPFFYQDRAQVFTNYGSLINHRKKNLPENIIGTDEAKDFIQEILSLDNNGHPSP